MRPSFSLGIEEEYQTIDPVTRDLRSHIQTEMLKTMVPATFLSEKPCKRFTVCFGRTGIWGCCTSWLQHFLPRFGNGSE